MCVILPRLSTTGHGATIASGCSMENIPSCRSVVRFRDADINCPFFLTKTAAAAAAEDAAPLRCIRVLHQQPLQPLIVMIVRITMAWNYSCCCCPCCPHAATVAAPAPALAAAAVNATAATLAAAAAAAAPTAAAAAATAAAAAAAAQLSLLQKQLLSEISAADTVLDEFACEPRRRRSSCWSESILILRNWVRNWFLWPTNVYMRPTHTRICLCTIHIRDNCTISEEEWWWWWFRIETDFLFTRNSQNYFGNKKWISRSFT